MASLNFMSGVRDVTVVAVYLRGTVSTGGNGA
jgi:hypothetical protein